MRPIEKLKLQTDNEAINLEVCYVILYKALKLNSHKQMIDAIRFYLNTFPDKDWELKQNVKEKISNCIMVPGIDYLSLEAAKIYVTECIDLIMKQFKYIKVDNADFAYYKRTLFEPTYSFAPNTVLFEDSQKRDLKVSDFLKVVKYSIKIAQSVDPQNKDYEKASAAISVFEGLDAVLNNKPEDMPLNKMLHLTNDFLTSVVKTSFEKERDKTNLIVTSLMIDLVIDFLCQK